MSETPVKKRLILRCLAASAGLYYFFAEFVGVEIPTYVFGAALGVLSVTVILRGRYAALEFVTKILAGMLVVSAFAVYCVEPAPLSAMGRFFVFGTPEGSWLVIAATSSTP